MRFFSQLGQDVYVFDRFFRGLTQGIFVDVGAYDGVTFSNTFFFERYLNWHGICFEPLPSIFEQLKRNRSSVCMPFAICDYDGIGRFTDVEVETDGKMLSGLTDHYHPLHLERISNAQIAANDIEVQVRTLSRIIHDHDYNHINYLSIDTEGAELAIIEEFDFLNVKVDVLSLENNYNDDIVRQLLRKRGFELVHVFDGYDELYCRDDILKCSVDEMYLFNLDAVKLSPL